MPSSRKKPTVAPALPATGPTIPSLRSFAFARTIYAHNSYLEDSVLIHDAGKLAGIPGVMIHGRSDLGGGVDTPWELAHAWPGMELIVVEGSGHTGSTAMTRPDARCCGQPLRADHKRRLAGRRPTEACVRWRCQRQSNLYVGAALRSKRNWVESPHPSPSALILVVISAFFMHT